MKIRNIFGNRYSGTIGKRLVAVEGRTTDYLRAYAKPSNPNSDRQRAQRARHIRSLAAWQDLAEVQKDFYRRLEAPRRGFDVLMGRAMLALGRGDPIEAPVRMSWSPEGGPIDGASLIVRRRSVRFFSVRLAATVEVALTPSDVPYALVLALGSEEEGVLTLDRSWRGDAPGDLVSARLGIRLRQVGADTSGSGHPGGKRTIREVLGMASGGSSRARTQA